MTSPDDPEATREDDDAERTVRFPVAIAPRWFGENRGPAAPDQPPEEPPGPDAPGTTRRRRPRALLVAAAVVGLLAVVYVVDLVVSAADVPRGVAVAGVDVGGTSRPDALAALHEALGPRVTRPVTVLAGDTSVALDPRAAGLDVDWDATLRRAGEQPLNPWTRLTSFFTTRTVEPVSTGDPAAVERALAAVRPQLDRAPVEGTITFRGATPVAVPSRAGLAIDPAAGAGAVRDHWLDPAPVELPTATSPTSVTAAGLDAAMTDVARPATAGPVTVVADRRNVVLRPEDVGGLLRFDPDGAGGLRPRVDVDAARRVLSGPLRTTESAPKDATFTSAPGGAATLVPAVLGRTVDYVRTAADLVDALRRPVDGRTPPVFTPAPAAPGAPPAAPPPALGRAVNAAYVTTPPTVTTEALAALGPAQVVGEFTTRGFTPDSGRNIRRVAEILDGRTVAPGALFSLNQATGPRTAANGFVEAGIIDDGAPGKGIAGGTSQFATTLYNASYFAGLQEVAHQEHSYYITRYPAGREATVFEGSIDLTFRNDGPTPILIRTQWTPSSITVQIYGQKRFDVTSEPGPRTNPTPPDVRDLSASPPCTPSNGAPGFTITDTRVLRDVRTGEIRREPRTVRYDPAPRVTCTAAAPPAR